MESHFLFVVNNGKLNLVLLKIITCFGLYILHYMFKNEIDVGTFLIYPIVQYINHYG